MSEAGSTNPLLQEFERAMAGAGDAPLGEVRDRAIATYAFAAGGITLRCTPPEHLANILFQV